MVTATLGAVDHPTILKDALLVSKPSAILTLMGPVVAKVGSDTSRAYPLLVTDDSTRSLHPEPRAALLAANVVPL